MRIAATILLLFSPVFADPVASPRPLPIDPLWKSEAFRKTITGSFGIDSRIEPRITVDEEFYLKQSAEAMAAGERKKAIEALRDSDLLDRSAIIRFQLGTLQFEEGETESAIAHFREALKQFPNFRDAHRNLAIALVQQQKPDDALPHLTRSLELGSREGVTMGLLGYCHSLKGHHQPALDAYRLAALTQPDERQWKVGEAQALAQLGQQEAAISIYQQLIDDAPSETNLWLVQADALLTLDQSLPAIANLELAHRANALSPAATLSLGHLYLQNGLPDLGLSRYEQAIATETPVELVKAIEAVEMLLQLQDFPRARKVVKLMGTSYPSASLQPERPGSELAGRLLRANALIEMETGNPEAGVRQLQAWLQREPTDGLALILLSRFYVQSDSREEAEMLLEQAEGLTAHSAEAHWEHAKLLVANGEYEEALSHLEKSCSIEPNESRSRYLEAIRELAD